MIESIRIRNKGPIKRLDIDKMCDINLFVGKHGVGKTTVLDHLGMMRDCDLRVFDGFGNAEITDL